MKLEIDLPPDVAKALLAKANEMNVDYGIVVTKLLRDVLVEAGYLSAANRQ